MFKNYYESVEVREIVDERQVEGLINLCKEMAGKNDVDKMALAFIPFDKSVVKEATKRILGR